MRETNLCTASNKLCYIKPLIVITHKCRSVLNSCRGLILILICVCVCLSLVELTPLVSSPVMVTRWKSGTTSSSSLKVSTIDANCRMLVRVRSLLSCSDAALGSCFFALNAVQNATDVTDVAMRNFWLNVRSHRMRCVAACTRLIKNTWNPMGVFTPNALRCGALRYHAARWVVFTAYRKTPRRNATSQRNAPQRNATQRNTTRRNAQHPVWNAP